MSYILKNRYKLTSQYLRLLASCLCNAQGINILTTSKYAANGEGFHPTKGGFIVIVMPFVILSESSIPSQGEQLQLHEMHESDKKAFDVPYIGADVPDYMYTRGPFLWTWINFNPSGDK